MIAAKNAEALRVLNQKMKQRQIKKFYLCLVHGKMVQNSGTLKGYAIKNEMQNKVYITSTPGTHTKEICTRYRVLKEFADASLLEIELLTGRTHQIRAHLASIGHPLLGDRKYGKAENKKSPYAFQALYSYRLLFLFTGEQTALDYLSGKSFTVQNVPFMQSYKSGGLQTPGNPVINL